MRYALALPRPSRRALAVTLRHWWAWRKFYKTSLLLNFGEPVMNLVALGWGLGSYVSRIDDLSFLEFVGPGLMAVTAMNSVVFDMAFGGYTRLREQGVYDAMISTSLREEEIVAGDLAWQAARSVLYGSIFLLVLAVAGLVRSPWALAVPLVLAVNGILFGSLTLLVVAKARQMEDLFYYFTLAITPMFLFSGVFFPVERLPEAVQGLVRVLPLNHTVQLLRDLVLGRVDGGTLGDLAWLAGATALVLPWPVRLMRAGLDR